MTDKGVTLVGGGPVRRRDLGLCLARAPVVVAADGGADRLLAHGVVPEAVIGDFDSISAAARAAILVERQHLVAEQATTDFDKALRLVRAPFVLALGFAGARMDHALAAMTTLVVRADQPCILIGPEDLAFACPSQIALTLPVGERVSLYPMARVRGVSHGLEWPIDGIDFAPDGVIGTSNRVVGPVVVEMERRGMVMILPRRRLDAVITALRRR